jgi:hypothetical protein
LGAGFHLSEFSPLLLVEYVWVDIVLSGLAIWTRLPMRKESRVLELGRSLTFRIMTARLEIAYPVKSGAHARAHSQTLSTGAPFIKYSEASFKKDISTVLNTYIGDF